MNIDFLIYGESFCLQSTLSYIKKTSSLEAYIEWFNRLGYLVATEICLVRRKAALSLSHWVHLFSFISCNC